jgi:hypothetical protein
MPSEQEFFQLQQRVKTLEDHLKQLPTQFFQQGPVPGWLRASKIGPGPAVRSSLFIDQGIAQAGVAPLETVTDAGGIQRVQIGNLAAYTDPGGIVSPAQYGLRTLDPNGNLLLDSTVLANIGTSLDIFVQTPLDQTFTSTTYATVLGSTGTVTLAATQTLLCMIFVIAFNSAASNASPGRVRFNPGAAGVPTGDSLVGVANYTTFSFWQFLHHVPAGNYTMTLQAAMAVAGNTLTVHNSYFEVIALGS